MNNSLFKMFVAVAALWGSLSPGAAWATDSYRWLKVTIDTPWAIFLFLLPMVLVPVVLMAILYWRFTVRPVDPNEGRGPRKNKDTEAPPQN